VRRLLGFLDSLADKTGLFVAPMTLAMMFLTCIVVVARYLFRTGATPLQESVMYLHGVVFMLAIAWTLKVQGHVRVDILYHKFSPRARAMVDLLGTVFFLTPVCVFIFWTSLDYVSLSWSMQESSATPDGLPGIYLLKTLIPVTAVLLLLQGIAEIIRNLAVLLDADG